LAGKDKIVFYNIRIDMLLWKIISYAIMKRKVIMSQKV